MSDSGMSTWQSAWWTVTDHLDDFTEELSTQLMTTLDNTVEIMVTKGKNWLDIVAWSFFTPLSIICFFGNTLVLIAFMKYRKIRTPTNYLLCNLAVGDLISGVCNIIYTFYSFTDIGQELAQNNRYACIVPITATGGITMCSVAMITAISIERVIAVLTPLKHRTLVTKTRVISVNTFIWLMFCLFFIIPVSGINVWEPKRKCAPIYVYPSFVLTIVFLMPMAMMAVGAGNAMVALVAFRRFKKFTNGMAKSPCDVSSAVQLKQQVKQYKITRMLLTVVGSFYICWLPLSLMVAAGVINPSFKNDTLLEVCRAFRLLNIIINPIIYSSQNDRFYKAFKDILLCGMK